MRNHVVVIGAGLVGLATARRLSQLSGDLAITVVEKERGIAQHQSTHNSGVLHAGLYYKPGSLKARLAVEGLREMLAFCREHVIPHEQCGKLIVATDEAERERLPATLERGRQNGLSGLQLLGAEEMREREPNVGGIAGLLVPEEGIVDFHLVATTMAAELRESGTDIRTGAKVTGLLRQSDGWRIFLENGSEIDANFIVGCGGLHADRLARLAGLEIEVRIIPFRGEYYQLREERRNLVRHLIYPVPDARFPFLGVHFTRTIHGGIVAGPNAVLAFAREGYRWKDVNARDLAESLRYRGLWAFLARHAKLVVGEFHQSMSKRRFAASLARLVPDVTEADLVASDAGVRAQAMRRDGSLVEDFTFAEEDRCIFVLNAPSPAATASLALGGYIAKRLESRFAAYIPRRYETQREIITT